jgi:ribose transport system permease protein
VGENGFILFFLLWCIFLSLSTDTFLTSRNLIGVLRQASITSILAVGEMLVVLTGAMDVSLAALLGFCGVLSAGLMVAGLPPVLAGLAGVGLGGLIGIVNGLIVTRLKINSIVATLGMLGILEGLTLLLTHGESIYGASLEAVGFLSSGSAGPLPVPVIIMLALYAFFHVVLGRTVWGAQLYAIGSNERAAWLSGVPVDRVRSAAFVIAGMLAGLGGVMQVARLGAATATMGGEFLFAMLTAVVLSGTSLSGGRGRVLNVLIASIFLVTITNGLILLSVPTEWQRVVSGLILILALSLDRLRARAGG